MAASTGVLRIGGNSIWGEWFAGLIDEVRVYNRVLSAGEIQQDMQVPDRLMGPRREPRPKVAALKCFVVRGRYEEQLAIGMNVK